MVEALKLAGEYSPSPTGDHSALNGSVNGETNTSDHEDGSDDSDEWQVSWKGSVAVFEVLHN